MGRGTATDAAAGDVHLRLPSRRAQAAALVWAVEEHDRGGRLLDLEARRRATRDAVGSTAGGGARADRWLARRAEQLRPRLDAPFPHLGRLLRFTDPGAGWTWPVSIVAFVSGIASNALGPSQQVNVLAPPLLALVAWNLAVLALLGVRALVPMLWTGPPPGRRVAGWMEAVARRWIRVRGDGDDAELRRRVLGAYLGRWLPAAAPLTAARVRRLLHTSALLMVAGVVAGMYLRGLVLEYRASWESTFLDAAAVDRFLGWVLAPAAAVLGAEVPAAAALARPPGGPAAPWIHLWALTAGLFVGLPRLLLALASGARAARLARRLPLPLPAAYVRRLRTAESASVDEVRLEPYSYRPAERAVRALRGLLLDLAGARARVRLASTLAYGDEPEPFDGGLRVLLFSLAQTPELEVHGEVVARARDELADGQSLLVVVDVAPYRRRLDPGDAGRLEERRRAWRRALAATGVEPAFVDLDAEAAGPEADAAFAALEAARWPVPEAPP